MNRKPEVTESVNRPENKEANVPASLLIQMDRQAFVFNFAPIIILYMSEYFRIIPHKMRIAQI